MERRVLIDAFQKVTNEDFLNFGIFPRDSLDTIVSRLLIPDIGFSGFNTVASAPTQVTVGNGKFFYGGKVYFNDTDGGFVLDLLPRLPAATRRIVAITAWGTDVPTQVEPRTFLTDAETEQTIARATSTEQWRWANIGAVNGVEGPDPQRPAVASDVIVVAWVTLTTTGIESIVMNTDGMVPSLREADDRLNAFDVWRAVIGSLLDTLRSDLAALARRIAGLATYNLVRQVAQDLSSLKEQARLPDTFKAYGIDHFLTDEESDLLHVDWLARVEEGVRFPPAAGFDMQLGLLNPLDELVIGTAHILLPAWDPVSRVQNLGTDSELSISQYQFQTVDMVQKFLSRSVTRYGPAFTICTNATHWWNWANVDLVNWTYRRGDETFAIVNSLAPMGILDPYGSGFVDVHSMIRLQYMWQDTILEPYWDRVVQKFSISGSVVAQTFLNAQDGWLSAVEIYFSRVAATGNVEMMICETTNGHPDYDKVIARTTKLVADLQISPAGAGRIPTRFTFNPTYLKKERYAIVLVSAGNHYVWTLDNTNLVSGTLFQSTDGEWFEGDPTKDLAFEVFFCKFRRNMTRVQLNSLTLNGGIAAIHINADSYSPPGTKLFYEVQHNGIWKALDPAGEAPELVLAGLPPLLPFRAVFVGTDSVQPALGVASNSRVTTWRPRSDYRHISTAVTLPANTTNLEIDVRLESWRGAPHHTFAGKLLVGAGYTTVVNPTTIVVEPAPDDPENAVIYHLGWTSLMATNTFRLRMEGTTDNVLATYHVAERFHIDPDLT